MVKIQPIEWGYFDNPERASRFSEEHDAYYASQEWKNKREQRLMVDNYECAICGNSDNLQVHHLYGLSNDDTESLITLCQECHEQFHRHYDRMKSLHGLIIEENRSFREWRRGRLEIKSTKYTIRYVQTVISNDIVFGGQENLCNWAIINKHIDAATNAELIWPMVFQEIVCNERYIELFRYFSSGYSKTEVSGITGLSVKSTESAYKRYLGLKHYLYESEEYGMKKVDMSNVREPGENRRPPAGAYICQIIKAEDNPDKEYLIVTYDIAEGEYKGYYGGLREEHPDWTSVGRYFKSYKTKALPMFKRFCSAISKSNGAFVFDGSNANSDESTLKGRLVGLVFQEEEYYSNSGDKRTRLVVSKEFPIDKLAEQKIPPVKRLEEEPAKQEAATSPDGFINIPEGMADDGVPF